MQRTSTTFRTLWADKNGRETETVVVVRHDDEDAICNVVDEAYERLPAAVDVVLECDPIRGYFA